MFNSVALDVVFGLIFIFLLYSLFATTIGEGLSSLLNIRGRILMKSVERMLTDDFVQNKVKRRWSARVDDFVRALFIRTGRCYKRSLAEKFYHYPSIKYLSQAILFKYPSYISAANFSSSLIEILRHKGTASTIMQEITNGIESPFLCSSPETKKHLHDLAIKANGDANVFKLLLEIWFNEMMDRASGWYKRNVQLLQFVIGFVLAAAININTLDIVKILSVNETTRSNLVTMATNPERLKRMGEQAKGDTVGKIDTVYQKTLQTLSDDSKAVSQLLGSGWHFEDSLTTCVVQIHTAKNLDFLDTLVAKKLAHVKLCKSTVADCPDCDSTYEIYVLQKLDSQSLQRLQAWSGKRFKKIDSLCLYNKAALKGEHLTSVTFYGRETPDFIDRVGLVIGEIFSNSRNFFGLLITALALCLGAPFWFDLLSKFITLRGGGKNPDAKEKEASSRSDGKKFDSVPDKLNSFGHHLSEHTLKDPVRYALALNDQFLRSIPGVISVNKDFEVVTNGVKTACIEVSVTPACDKSRIPKSYSVNFEGTKVDVPVKIDDAQVATFQSAQIVFASPRLAIRNKFVSASKKKEWGTISGLVKHKGKRVVLSCSHVLRGDNRRNEVNSEIGILWREAKTDPQIDGELPIGKLLFQYQSNAFDIAWSDLSDIKKENSASNKFFSGKEELKEITRPRTISDMDATCELQVKMNGAVSGDVQGILWNNSVEFEFETETGNVTMFNLLKLTQRIDNGFKAMSAPGDSGALVCDTSGNPIGIVVGGNEQFTYALKLTEVFSRFEEIHHFDTV